MAKQTATPKTRLVNRNEHLKAASKIVAILETVDPAKVAGVLKIVQEAMQTGVPVDEDETPPALFNGEAAK